LTSLSFKKNKALSKSILCFKKGSAFFLIIILKRLFTFKPSLAPLFALSRVILSTLVLNLAKFRQRGDTPRLKGVPGVTFLVDPRIGRRATPAQFL